jgi:hypothetical protein
LASATTRAVKSRIMLHPVKVIARAPSIPLGPREHGEQVDKHDDKRNRAENQVDGHGVASEGWTLRLGANRIKARAAFAPDRVRGE